MYIYIHQDAWFVIWHKAKKYGKKNFGYHLDKGFKNIVRDLAAKAKNVEQGKFGCNIYFLKKKNFKKLGMYVFASLFGSFWVNINLCYFLYEIKIQLRKNMISYGITCIISISFTFKYSTLER